MNITFKVYENEAGGCAVVLPERRVKENLCRLEHQRDQAKSDPEREAFQSLIDKTMETYQWASSSPGWKDRTFEIKRYTTGQKNRASSEATSWESGQPRRDETKFWRELVIVSTGLSPTEVDDLHPQLFEALVDEIRYLVEPNLDQVRFFGMSPTCWPQLDQ